MLSSGAGIFNLLPIAYSNWPRLRGRLTLSGWTVLTEPLGFRRTGISPVFSLLIPTYSLLRSTTCPYGQACIYRRTLPYLYTRINSDINHSFGNSFKPRSFFSAKRLDQWAVTLSLKDCCLQAHLLAVYAFSLLLPLNEYFGTLADGLGCFPLDYGAYPPQSDSYFQNLWHSELVKIR